MSSGSFPVLSANADVYGWLSAWRHTFTERTWAGEDVSKSTETGDFAVLPSILWCWWLDLLTCKTHYRVGEPTAAWQFVDIHQHWLFDNGWQYVSCGQWQPPLSGAPVNKWLSTITRERQIPSDSESGGIPHLFGTSLFSPYRQQQQGDFALCVLVDSDDELVSLMANTHRWRDATVELSRVGSVKFTTSSRRLPTDAFTLPTRRSSTRCWQICSGGSIPKRPMKQNGPHEGQKRPITRAKTDHSYIQNDPLVCQKRPLDQTVDGTKINYACIN